MDRLTKLLSRMYGPDPRDARIAELEAALAERTRERNNANQMVDASTGWYRACRDAEAALAERTRERDEAIRRADALAGTLSRILAAVAPKDVKLADGRTMRFVPPDPEAYWRALSDAIDAALAGGQTK